MVMVVGVVPAIEIRVTGDCRGRRKTRRRNVPGMKVRVHQSSRRLRMGFFFPPLVLNSCTQLGFPN